MKQFAANPVYKFFLFPIGQILLFAMGASVILSLATVLLAYVFKFNVTDFDLVERTMLILPQVIINGLTIGFVYSTIALGYTMVYGVLEFINFSHSEIFMVGGIVGIQLMAYFEHAGLLANMNEYLVIALAILLALVVSGSLAVTVERVAYKPLRGAPKLVPLISAIGMSFFLQDIVRLILSLTTGEFNVILPKFGTFDEFWKIAVPGMEDPLRIQIKSVLIVGVAMLMLLILNFLVNGTKVGKAIRAVAQDRPSASLMGINVNQIISITFLIGGALGGAAGVLFALKATKLDPFSGFFPGLKAFTSAVLGGIGNLTGALLGGLVLGLLESFSASYLGIFTNGAFGAEYKDIFAFAILIVVLIFRPSGLLGQTVGQKA
ncbi:MAG TPA: branched-chain amino acid ABC transporter permease [Anaerolineales bacterium]|nr:branched-chain amino acid ABC transporter permease [Anaerolineales bacterium]HNA88312.1 branched-chain amino acid ABC transporter permease [Anaerolineales bacterium]HNB35301.1 branched-chain amino acid ABC transporter permease [Anaerolineales bacterium]